MKIAVFLTSVVLVAVESSTTYKQHWKDMDDETIYRYIFDEVDMDHIILNDRICDVYLRCFYDTGPCTSLAAAIKSRITEVFSTVCGKCTDKQKEIWRYALETFIPRRPKDWEKILSIYDPKGEYWPNIKNFLDNPPPK